VLLLDLESTSIIYEFFSSRNREEVLRSTVGFVLMMNCAQAFVAIMHCLKYRKLYEGNRVPENSTSKKAHLALAQFRSDVL